jgi:hypothetical protein
MTEQEFDFERWEAAIGKVVLACARVEYELIGLYEKWMPDRIYHDDSYEGRYDKAIGVARSSLPKGNEIATNLIEMKKYARYRHLVAHNPIHYSSESDTWKIFDLKNNEIEVSLSELEEISGKAYKLSVQTAVLLRVNV